MGTRRVGRMFVPVFFRAEHGGLHNHVEAQIRAAKAGGFHVTLQCRAGPWADKMSALCSVIHADYDDLDACVAAGLAAGPYDLVHAHPYASRRVGMEVAARLGIPIIVTNHGPYLDELDVHHQSIDMVVCISEATRRKIIWKSKMDPARTVVIPNGVDRHVFKVRRHRSSESRRVIVPSRFDVDKKFLIKKLLTTWEGAAQDPETWADVEWLIVGDGTKLPDLKKASAELNAALGGERVHFTGWATPKELARLFASSAVAVAPGRSALEALASGLPTVALGSRGYTGLIDGPGALDGLHANFGGAGSKGAADAMLIDVRNALDPEQFDRRMRLGSAIAAIHDQRLVDAAHQRLWNLMINLPPRESVSEPEPSPSSAS